MFRYLSLAFRNSVRNRRRSILTISSIAVSLCLLGVLLAIYHAMFNGQATPGQALRLVVRHRVSLGQPIPTSYKDKIRKVPGVREVSSWDWFGGTFKDGRDQKNFFARFAVEPKAFMTIRTQMEMPEEQRHAFLTEQTACIVSKDLADSLKLKLGQRVTLTGDIYPVTLQLIVRGIFEDPDSAGTMYFNLAYLREALPVGPRRNFDSVIALLADSPDSVPKIAKTIDDMYANAPYPTKTESEQQFALSFLSFLGNIKLYLMSVCAAVTFTILLVSGNTMAMSVRERIKEVGILKTLGFTNDAILGMILAESVTIALLGGIVGLFIASFLVVGVGKAGQSFVGQLHNLSLGASTIFLSLGVALLIGFVSSFIPAWNASHTNILDSLRSSG